MNTLVLGVGNLLLQDEGAGIRAVEEYARRFTIPAEVEILDGGTSGIELLQYIRGRDLLIIVDVVRCGTQPGSLCRLEGAEVPALFQKKISPHQMGISDLLATAHMTGSMPKRVVLLGIEPKSIDTGLELSADVGGNVGALAEMIAGELSSAGLSTSPLLHVTP